MKQNCNKQMGAPKENSNAEVWTEKQAKKFVDSVYKYIQNNDNCVFIGEAIIESDGYRDLWNYIKKKFDFRLQKTCEEILEHRLVNKALNSDFNATMSIFTLKNHHGWKDKKEVESTNKTEHSFTPRTLEDLYKEENAVSEPES